MGVNNRKRRAAKAKQRGQRRHQGNDHGRGRRSAWGVGGDGAGGDPMDGTGWGPEPHPRRPQGTSLTDIVMATVEAAALGERRLVGKGLRLLLAEPPGTVAATVAGLAETQVRAAWRGGWQPADLARHADRRLGQLASDVLRAAIAFEAQTYGELGARVAPAWRTTLPVGLPVRPCERVCRRTQRPPCNASRRHPAPSGRAD